MTRRRASPDGLPYRLYERLGKRRYSIGYKGADNRWQFRLHCDAGDAIAIQRTRADAIRKSAQLLDPAASDDSFAVMSAAFFSRQDSLPLNSSQRRAESTLQENRREARNLVKSFGAMNVHHMKPHHAYEYLDACDAAGRGPKGNKEISLAVSMFELYVRTDRLRANPFKGIRKILTSPESRLVTENELNFVLTVGRDKGGIKLLAALILWVGYLCVRRPGEVLSLTKTQLTDDGIQWTATKARNGRQGRRGLIEWSDKLREIIDEARTLKRHDGAPDEYVLGNLAGHRYTKGGWKKTLNYLMNDCVSRAAAQGRTFKPFNLQHCRPAGVTAKLLNNDGDVLDATLHTSERMVKQVYDRRAERRAKPAQ